MAAGMTNLAYRHRCLTPSLTICGSLRMFGLFRANVCWRDRPIDAAAGTECAILNRRFGRCLFWREPFCMPTVPASDGKRGTPAKPCRLPYPRDRGLRTVRKPVLNAGV